MKIHRILLSTALLVLALGALTPQFAQETTINPSQPDPEKHAQMLGLLRELNTLEATDFHNYGSYASWQTLLERHLKDLNGWLARYYSREANAHFGEMPEILPAWNLRLSVQANGQGYVVLLEDTNEKTGYAALSDELGIIRECKYLQ
jgi:hypothetical protein